LRIVAGGIGGIDVCRQRCRPLTIEVRSIGDEPA
jgi:hypothetical protein